MNKNNMRTAFAVVVCLILATTACQQLGIGGKCHDLNGNEISHVTDAEGNEWQISKISYEDDFGDYTNCAIPAAAVPFRGIINEVKAPDGTRLWLLGKTEGKWVIAQSDAEWY